MPSKLLNIQHSIIMFLWESIAFGPVKSRRLGSSLGINLLPTSKKICSFNCVYCECGWTEDESIVFEDFYPLSIVMEVIEKKIANCYQENISIDSITFAGNGEPTLHPDFGKIVDKLIILRDRYYPEAVITCLSNSTQLHREDVKKALQRIENPIMKLDAGYERFYQWINQPLFPVNLSDIIENLKTFNGKVIIQTLFTKEITENETFDNSSGDELKQLMENIRSINPSMVMLYSLDRETPDKQLIKIEKERLEDIAHEIERMNVKAGVY